MMPRSTTRDRKRGGRRTSETRSSHSDDDFSGYKFVEGDADTLRYQVVSEGSGGSSDVSWPAVPAAQKSPTLTIWRTLWTELDNMAHPDTQTDPGKKGSFDPVDDDEKFDPGNVDTSFLATEMAKAKIRVRTLPANFDTRDDLDFFHNLPIEHTGSDDFQEVRDVGSEDNFWSAHLMGVYESDDGYDYDANGTPWHVGQSFQTIMIYHEVLRDLAANYLGAASQADMEKRLVLHEVLHRFFGAHTKPPSDPTPCGVTEVQCHLRDEGVMDSLVVVTGTTTDNLLSPIQKNHLQDSDPEL